MNNIYIIPADALGEGSKPVILVSTADNASAQCANKEQREALKEEIEAATDGLARVVVSNHFGG